MSGFYFKSEPCECPAGQCAHFVEPDTNCIHRLSGDVRTKKCRQCGHWTWHHDGNCLQCKDHPPAHRSGG